MKTTNKDWGFFGTLQRNYAFSEEATERLYSKVGKELVVALKTDPGAVRVFLDSRYGRHFADELSFHGAESGMSEKKLVEVVKAYISKVEDQEINRWVFNEIASNKRCLS